MCPRRNRSPPPQLPHPQQWVTGGDSGIDNACQRTVRRDRQELIRWQDGREQVERVLRQRTRGKIYQRHDVELQKLIQQSLTCFHFDKKQTRCEEGGPYDPSATGLHKFSKEVRQIPAIGIGSGFQRSTSR